MTSALTLIHVAICFVAIGAGLGMARRMLDGDFENGWTTVFMLFTALTLITSFLFPFHGVTPGIVSSPVGQPAARATSSDTGSNEEIRTSAAGFNRSSSATSSCAATPSRE